MNMNVLFLLYHISNNNFDIANITIIIVHYHAGRKNRGPLLGRSPESSIPFLGSEYPSRLGKDKRDASHSLTDKLREDLTKEQ